MSFFVVEISPTAVWLFMAICWTWHCSIYAVKVTHIPYMGDYQVISNTDSY